jgi:hypothetical protein
MVWGGICSKGKTKLRIVEKGAKINSVFYIENILKPFLAKDILRLYPKNDYFSSGLSFCPLIKNDN